MSQTKFPEELHLTFKEQREYDGEKYVIGPLPLAFAHVYEPDKKGWDKKRLTQLNWAYDGFKEQEDGIWLEAGREWQGLKIVNVPARRVPDHLQPRVIKNDPMSGFKISHSVSRCSTSNKVWRIEDPRGFELEIPTSNMEGILMEGGVIKGEIQGTLQWWTGKMLKYVK